MQNAYSISSMDKKELRKEIKTRLKSISRAYCQQASTVINDKVVALDEFKKADTVLCFVGTLSEPDTRGIIATSLEQGKKVCLPLCISEGIMEAKEIKDFDDLEYGAYNLLEPKKTLPTVEPEDIDFAVIPCVTCNHEGDRLGHGKGYYDRYLENQKFPTAMICFEKLITDDIPTDEYDKKIDMVITEK